MYHDPVDRPALYSVNSYLNLEITPYYTGHVRRNSGVYGGVYAVNVRRTITRSTCALVHVFCQTIADHNVELPIKLNFD